MTAAAPIAALRRQVRQRRLAAGLLLAAPLLPVMLLLAAQSPAFAAMAAVVAAGMAVAAIVGAWRLPDRWLRRRLDALPVVEDSADLLLVEPAGLTTVQRLQRDRIAARLIAAAPDVRPPWPWRGIATTAGVAAVVIAVALAWPAPVPLAATAGIGPRARGVPALVDVAVRIVPPAYTRREPVTGQGLDIAAPAGSRIEWMLRFRPAATAVALIDAGGHHPLRRTGDTWQGGQRLAASHVYRLQAEPAGAASSLHRLTAIADRPPEVRLLTPAVTRAAADERRWTVRFAARDDYAVAAAARLHLTVAAGEGEDVRFHDLDLPVSGVGAVAAKTFVATVDLAGFHLAPGTDVVARLTVADNRPSSPQTATSTSAILRVPAAVADGIAGLGLPVTAAAFRSERQIIIDAEALIRARPTLAPTQFLGRSDGIAADQRLLRLRYGQFLGEEQEGTTPPPTADAPPATGFGREGDTLAEHGHVHDEAGAATLLDPDTRAHLKAALDAMWAAELALRQGQPAGALAPAGRALALIKQVQQATRVFLARTGPTLPEVDATRRLTGRRDGLAASGLPPVTGDDPGVAAAAAAWQAATGPASVAALATIERWLARAPAGVDPLAVAVAVDAVRRDPACAACRPALAAQVWRGLPPVAPGIAARDGGGAAGARYLAALGRTP